MLLYEKYRPRRLEDVVGQPKAVETVRGLLARGIGGRAVWINGPSGTGKTTLARIIAGQLAEDWVIHETDSGADLTRTEVDALANSLGLYGPGKGGRAIIVNESHSIRADVLDKLKGVLERIPAHAAWIFTTTREDEAALFDDHVGAAQLLSRCHKVSLTNQGLAQAGADYLLKIARAEGLDGQPREAYVKLMQRCKNNFRAALEEIDQGGMLRGGGA